MHLCINNYIDKCKHEFPRTKLERNTFAWLCIYALPLVIKLWRGDSYEAINRYNPAYCCASSKSGLCFQRYGRFAVEEWHGTRSLLRVYIAVIININSFLRIRLNKYLLHVFIVHTDTYISREICKQREKI